MNGDVESEKPGIEALGKALESRYIVQDENLKNIETNSEQITQISVPMANDNYEPLAYGIRVDKERLRQFNQGDESKKLIFKIPEAESSLKGKKNEDRNLRDLNLKENINLESKTTMENPASATELEKCGSTENPPESAHLKSPKFQKLASRIDKTRLRQFNLGNEAKAAIFGDPKESRKFERASVKSSPKKLILPDVQNIPSCKFPEKQMSRFRPKSEAQVEEKSPLKIEGRSPSKTESIDYVLAGQDYREKPKEQPSRSEQRETPDHALRLDKDRLKRFNLGNDACSLIWRKSAASYDNDNLPVKKTSLPPIANSVSQGQATINQGQDLGPNNREYQPLKGDCRPKAKDHWAENRPSFDHKNIEIINFKTEAAERRFSLRSAGKRPFMESPKAASAATQHYDPNSTTREEQRRSSVRTDVEEPPKTPVLTDSKPGREHLKMFNLGRDAKNTIYGCPDEIQPPRTGRPKPALKTSPSNDKRPRISPIARKFPSPNPGKRPKSGDASDAFQQQPNQPAATAKDAPERTDKRRLKEFNLGNEAKSLLYWG